VETSYGNEVKEAEFVVGIGVGNPCWLVHDENMVRFQQYRNMGCFDLDLLHRRYLERSGAAAAAERVPSSILEVNWGG
jgi:hypothetical protein